MVSIAMIYSILVSSILIIVYIIVSILYSILTLVHSVLTGLSPTHVSELS